MDTPNSSDNVGGYGDNDEPLILNPVLSGNDGACSMGDVAFGPAAWWTGNPKGLLRRLMIRGGSLTPRSGGRHWHVDKRLRSAVTFPRAGPPAVPQVVARGVSGLTGVEARRTCGATERIGRVVTGTGLMRLIPARGPSTGARRSVGS